MEPATANSAAPLPGPPTVGSSGSSAPAQVHPPHASRVVRCLRKCLFPLHWLGRQVTAVTVGIQRLTAFTLITLVTAIQKWGVASRVIHPLIREQILRSGVRLLPLVCVLGLALGFSIVGQVLVLLTQVGQPKLFAVIIGPVVIRELAPLAATLVVLTRVGTAMVTELGTARALGEIEALEALGIDPIHLLVVPRVIGLTVSVVALTIYLVLVSLLGGFLMGFGRGSTLTLAEYFGSLAGALTWIDFPLLGLKTLFLGAVNALIICYQGLAEPLRLEEVGDATARTVAHCILASLALDTLFLVTYFFV